MLQLFFENELQMVQYPGQRLATQRTVNRLTEATNRSANGQFLSWPLYARFALKIENSRKLVKLFNCIQILPLITTTEAVFTLQPTLTRQKKLLPLLLEIF